MPTNVSYNIYQKAYRAACIPNEELWITAIITGLS